MSYSRGLIIFCLVAAHLLALTEAEAQLRIGTVDINRVFQGDAKTKEAKAKINEAKAAATKELNERADVYKAAIAAINQLNAQLDQPALGAAAKAEKTAERDRKIAEIRGMEREITEFRQTRERQLQEQMQRMKEGIVRRITAVVLDLAQARKLDLVFDKSGASFNGFSPVLFAQESDDFTAEVISALQKTERKP